MYLLGHFDMWYVAWDKNAQNYISDHNERLVENRNIYELAFSQIIFQIYSAWYNFLFDFNWIKQSRSVAEDVTFPKNVATNFPCIILFVFGFDIVSLFSSLCCFVQYINLLIDICSTYTIEPIKQQTIYQNKCY